MINAWVYLQKAGRGEGMKNAERTQREWEDRAEGGEREWVGGVGSGSVFVHCVKCDHVLELLRQLGSSPVPGFQLVTL